MEAAGLLANANPEIARKIDALVLRLKRRQLVGSHNVAIETVNLLRDVVEAAKVTSFEGLLEALTQVGQRLQDAGRKEPVINNVLLRILKFLREEYHTALQSAIATITHQQPPQHQASSPTSQSSSSALPPHLQPVQATSPTSYASPAVETPGSLVSTPFAAFPLDTSASFGLPPGMKRQMSHFPFEELQNYSHSRANNMSTDSLANQIHSYHPQSSASTSQIQPIGTNSIFELLGHKKNSLDTSAAFSNISISDTSGSQTPTTPYPASTPFDSPGLAMRASSPSKSAIKNLALASSTTSLSSLHNQAQPSTSTSYASRLEAEFSRKAGALKPVFLDAITELLEELAINRDQISAQAMEHIHSAEIILTIGYSRTVEAFLRAASRKRKITVVVAETAPSYLGQKLALSLSSSGIPTLLIPDSGIYSLLSRISKIIIGAHSIRADGSLLAISGTLPLVVTAREQKVPVIVLSGMFKVSPEFSFLKEGGREDEFDYGNSLDVLLSLPASESGEGYQGEESQNGDSITQSELHKANVDVDVLAPYYDRVPGDLVDLYISNLGAHPGSMITRLLKELLE